MPRPIANLKRARIELRLPTDIADRLDLLLYSPLQGRVPYGAREKLITTLLEKFFASSEAAQLLKEKA